MRIFLNYYHEKEFYKFDESEVYYPSVYYDMNYFI